MQHGNADKGGRGIFRFQVFLLAITVFHNHSTYVTSLFLGYDVNRLAD